MQRIWAAAAVGLCLAAPAQAEPPALSLPIDCDLGQSCYIEDYVDLDPGKGLRDHACGFKTRDGHRGTDIVLLSFDAMLAGVDVLAAAPGTVSATRDGMQDRPVTPEIRHEIRGKECGNAVRIDHGDGWQTLYCHMRQGSVAVKTGDRVVAGTPLGQVGLSGLTNVPHVHLGVLKDGNVVDPFHREATAACNATDDDTLWAVPPAYDKAGLFTAGFSTAVPSLTTVQSGAARVHETSPEMPLLVYGHVFLAEHGDTLTITARGPSGDIFGKTMTLETPQKQIFRAYGRQAPAGGWPEGAYRGYVVLKRDGRVIANRHADITVTR